MTATPAARLKQAEDFLADWPDRASAFALTGILAAVVAVEERTVADDYLRELSDRQDAALGRVLALADRIDAGETYEDREVNRYGVGDMIREAAEVEEPKTDAERLEDAPAPTGTERQHITATVIAAHTFTLYPEEIACECREWRYGAPHPLTRAEHDDHLIGQWTQHVAAELAKVGGW